jgi:hypothetical protein
MLFSSLAIYCFAFLLSGSETKKLPTAESYCESFLADFLFYFRSYFLRKLFCRRKLHIKLYLPNCVRDVAEFRKPPWEEAVILAVW